MRGSGLVAALASFLIGSTVQAARPLSDLLERYRASLRTTENAAMEVLTFETFNALEGRVGWDVTSSNSVRKSVRSASQSFRWSLIADHQGSLSWIPQGVALHWHLNERLLTLEHSNGDSPRLKVKHDTRGDYVASMQGAMLCGYFPGYPDRIDRMLGHYDATVRPVPETIGGLSCEVVDAINGDEQYTIWFSSSNGCIVRVVRVTGGKTLSDRLVKLKLQPSAPEHVRGLRTDATRVVQTLDDVRLTYIGGKCVPVRGVFTEEIQFSHGPPSRVVQVVVRNRIELDPPVVDDSFTPKIPDGTPVRFIGVHSGVPQEWRDGGITPVNDKEVEKRLDSLVAGEKFVPPLGSGSDLRLLVGPVTFFFGLTAVPSLILFIRLALKRAGTTK